MANKPWQVMTDEEYDTYKSNKYLTETKGDPDGKFNAQNQALRDKYNITSDDYSYADLEYQSAFGANKFDQAANRNLYDAQKYQRYSDPYKEALYNAYDELKNFQYNPENDPSFKAYQNMYKRQGAAAQDKTYSDLTALSGGRNNSWAAAATAGVGQAYAQKISDVVPVLAEKAYNKLLQEYGILENKANKEYQRNQDAFNNAMMQYTANNQQANDYRAFARDQLEYKQQLVNDEVDNRYKESQIKNNELEGTILEQEIRKNNIELEYLDEKELQALLLGDLNIEDVKSIIEKRKAETESIKNKY